MPLWHSCKTELKLFDAFAFTPESCPKYLDRKSVYTVIYCVYGCADGSAGSTEEAPQLGWKQRVLQKVQSGSQHRAP